MFKQMYVSLYFWEYYNYMGGNGLILIIRWSSGLYIYIYIYIYYKYMENNILNLLCLNLVKCLTFTEYL